MTVFGRYVHSPSSTTAYGSLGSINNTGITLASESGTAGLTYTISPTMNNDLRANYTHTSLRESLTAPSFSGTLASLFPSGFAQPPGYSPYDTLLSFSFLGSRCTRPEYRPGSRIIDRDSSISIPPIAASFPTSRALPVRSLLPAWFQRALSIFSSRSQALVA